MRPLLAPVLYNSKCPFCDLGDPRNCRNTRKRGTQVERLVVNGYGSMLVDRRSRRT